MFHLSSFDLQGTISSIQLLIQQRSFHLSSLYFLKKEVLRKRFLYEVPEALVYDNCPYLCAVINARPYYRRPVLCSPFLSAPLLIRAIIIGALFDARPFYRRLY